MKAFKDDELNVVVGLRFASLKGLWGLSTPLSTLIFSIDSFIVIGKFNGRH